MKELQDFLKQSINKIISSKQLEDILSKKKLDYQQYPNKYEIYIEDKELIVEFENVKQSYFGGGIKIIRYNERKIPQEVPLANY